MRDMERLQHPAIADIDKLEARGAGRRGEIDKFASVHGSIHNHFNQERHLVDRQTFKLRRSAALAEWQSLMS